MNTTTRIFGTLAFALWSVTTLAKDVPFALPAAQTSTPPNAPNLLQSIDFGHDGDADLYFTAGGQIWRLSNQPSGLAATPIAVAAQANVASFKPGFLRPGQGLRRPDLVIARRAGGGAPASWLWLENNGGDSYTEHVIATMPGGTLVGAVGLIDMNRDGRLDLILTSRTGTGTSGATRIAVYTSQGPVSAPEFTLAWDVSPAAAHGIADIEVADLDRDGWPDFAVAGFDNDRVAWYRNLGNTGGFEQALVYDDAATVDLMDGPYALRVTDFSRDGAPDLAVAAFSSDQLMVFRSSGRGATFVIAQQATALPIQADGPSDLDVADLDQDGDPDLIVVGSADGRTVWYENTRQPATPYVAHALNALAGSFPLSVVALDADRDGDIDIVRTNFNANSLTVEKNIDLHATAAFLSQSGIGTGVSNRVYGVELADVDGDGRTDIARAAGDDTGPQSAFIGILKQQPNGTFSDGPVGAWAPSDGLAPHRGMAVGDYNRDGAPDLYGCYKQGASMVRFMAQNGVSGTQAQTNGFATRCEPRIADIDSDGDSDLLIPAGSGLRIDRGNGALPFVYTSEFLTLDKPLFDYALVDFDRDGDLDLVYSVYGHPSTETSQLRWLTNDGSGTFGSEVDLPIGGRQAGRITSGDINGDGYFDIVASGTLGTAPPESIASASPFWVSGSSGHVVHDIGSLPLVLSPEISVADVDHDGDLDISAIDRGQLSFAYLFEQAADGTFSHDPMGALAAPVLSSTLGDLNGDGWADAVQSTPQGLRWVQNRASNVQVVVQSQPNLSAVSSSSVWVATGVVDHLGRPGDDAAELTGFDIEILNGIDGEPFSVAQLRSFLQAVTIYRDENGDGQLGGDGIGVDIIDLQQVQSQPMRADPMLLVPHGETHRFFVELTFTHQAGTIAPQLRVRLDMNQASARHAIAETPLRVLPTFAIGPAFTVTKAPPYFVTSPGYAISLPEDIAVQGVSVLPVIARDPDQPAAHVGITYAVVGGSGQSRFGVQQGTGKIVYLGGAIRVGESYTLTVRATDQDGAQVELGININVTASIHRIFRDGFETGG